MQGTLKEIQSLSASRLHDLRRLKEGDIEGLSMNYFLENEKNRCSKENLHFFLLKKNKFYTTRLKIQIYNLCSKIIHEFYSSDLESLLDENDTNDIGIQAFYDLLNRFMETVKLNSYEKVNSILRPNNSTIVADTLCLILEQTRISLKKSVFNNYSKEKRSTKTLVDDDFQHCLKNQQPPTKDRKVGNSIKRMNTQGTISKFKSVEESAKVFQNEHKEYLKQKRCEFLENFVQEDLTQKFNYQFVELIKLNMGNKSQINKYYEKLIGRKNLTISSKNHGNLYTNEEKQEIIKDMEEKRNKFDEKLAVRSVPSSLEQNQDQIKQYAKNFIENKLVINELNKNLLNLQNRQISKINEWLPFGCFMEENDEFSLRLFIEDEDQLQKSFKPCPKSRSMTSILSNKLNQLKDIRVSQNMRYIPEVKKFKKQIVSCFNRKKIKELLEAPKISPSKRRVQTNASTTVLLPNINQRVERSQEKVDDIRYSGKDKKMQEKMRYKLSLKKLETKKLNQQRSNVKIVTPSQMTFNFINM